MLVIWRQPHGLAGCGGWLDLPPTGLEHVCTKPEPFPLQGLHRRYGGKWKESTFLTRSCPRLSTFMLCLILRSLLSSGDKQIGMLFGLTYCESAQQKQKIRCAGSWIHLIDINKSIVWHSFCIWLKKSQNIVDYDIDVICLGVCLWHKSDCVFN